jgi:hypothetical protein
MPVAVHFSRRQYRAPATGGPLLAKTRGKMRMKALGRACMALSALVMQSFAQAEGNAVVPSVGNAEQTTAEQMRGEKGRHLGTGSRIGDILNNPAFAGFGSLILPRDNHNDDESMLLSDIGSLLPYHDHVDPKVVVSGLNHMIDDVNSGKRVFYDFYTEAQKRAEPTREHTGLFFFRGRPGAPFAMIAPGGGFSYVGSVHEGFPYALEISKLGYNAFVLRYRVGYGGAVATQDMAAAISYVFRNAETLGVSTQDYSLWGRLGRRKDGGDDRFAWGREFRRRRPSEACHRRNGLHRPF